MLTQSCCHISSRPWSGPGRVSSRGVHSRLAAPRRRAEHRGLRRDHARRSRTCAEDARVSTATPGHHLSSAVGAGRSRTARSSPASNGACRRDRGMAEVRTERATPASAEPRRLFLPGHGCICECIDSPLCRHHHCCKQAEGWRLEQPEPDILRWRSPVGRTYATIPTRYPI